MIELQERLEPASFKGAPFLVNALSTEIGPKDVKHEYVNSSRQNIEFLGRQPKTFGIICVIHGTGQDYLDRRDALVRAVEEGGPGLLVHPTFGRLENYVARRGTLSEPIVSRLGRAEWPLTFDLDTGGANPEPNNNALPVIARNSDEVEKSLNEAIARGFEVTSAVNSIDAQGNLNGFADTLTSVTTGTAQLADKVNTYSAAVADFRESIPQLIQDPQALADSTLNLISEINSLYPTVTETITVFSGLFDFGDNLSEIFPTTVKRAERRTNRALVNGSTQIMALSQAYVLAADRQYTTTDDVEQQQQQLENQYQKIIAGEVPPSVIDTLDQLRASVNTFLNTERLNTGDVIDVDLGAAVLPSSVVAYAYYGSTQPTQILEDLNNITDTSFVSGEIKVVTA